MKGAGCDCTGLPESPCRPTYYSTPLERYTYGDFQKASNTHVPNVKVEIRSDGERAEYTAKALPECVVSLPMFVITAGEVSILRCFWTRISAISIPNVWLNHFRTAFRSSSGSSRMKRHRNRVPKECIGTL